MLAIKCNIAVADLDCVGIAMALSRNVLDHGA